MTHSPRNTRTPGHAPWPRSKSDDTFYGNTMEYGNTLDLCQEITEGTVSIVVTGSVFTGLANTC